MTMVSDGDEPPRNEPPPDGATWGAANWGEAYRAQPFGGPLTAAIAAWGRPSEPGSDPAMSGPGTPPPGRTAQDMIEFQTVVRAAVWQVTDVAYLLVDAASARPGATAQVSAAVHSLRLAADQLQGLIRPGTPGEDTDEDTDPDSGDTSSGEAP